MGMSPAESMALSRIGAVLYDPPNAERMENSPSLPIPGPAHERMNHFVTPEQRRALITHTFTANMPYYTFDHKEMREKSCGIAIPFAATYSFFASGMCALSPSVTTLSALCCTGAGIISTASCVLPICCALNFHYSNQASVHELKELANDEVFAGFIMDSYNKRGSEEEGMSLQEFVEDLCANNSFKELKTHFSEWKNQIVRERNHYQIPNSPILFSQFVYEGQPHQL